MDKSTILTEIAAALQEHIRHIEASVTRYKLASDIDDDDTMDPEDLSRQAEASDMQLRFEQLLYQAKEQEFFLMDHDDVLHDAVTPGALIETDSHFIYMGISIPAFTLENKTVITISEKAPAYSSMRGKKAGDTIELGEQLYKILSIV
ncbi:MAG: hypothetical protein RLZZ500_642 [Bacteroidota bacterium]|jgi:transcription elongation factor GreA